MCSKPCFSDSQWPADSCSARRIKGPEAARLSCACLPCRTFGGHVEIQSTAWAVANWDIFSGYPQMIDARMNSSRFILKSISWSGEEDQPSAHVAGSIAFASHTEHLAAAHAPSCGLQQGRASWVAPSRRSSTSGRG